VIELTNNMQDVDVGSPVDSLIVPAIAGTPIAAYVPGFGQFWVVFGATAFVFTFSRTAKISAWSQYNFPFNIDDIAPLANLLYLRSGNTVYQLDPAQFTDDGVTVNVTIEMPYLDFKLPGRLKQIYGVDAVCTGTALLQVRYDPRTPALITDGVTISGDTRPAAMIPFEVSAVEIAPVITHAVNEAFRLDYLRFYYNDLGTQ
jgi:hypothetical protein